MKYTAYNNEFNKIDDAPVSTKGKVLSWMKKRFSGLSERSDPQENEASIFFFDGEVVAYGTDNDGEVYLVECQDDSEV